MYAIMQDEGSVANLLLVEKRDSLGNSRLVYANLEQTLLHPAMQLMTFESVSEARGFIAEHPEVCDERCVICEAKFAPRNKSVAFEPIKS